MIQNYFSFSTLINHALILRIDSNLLKRFRRIVYFKNIYECSLPWIFVMPQKDITAWCHKSSEGRKNEHQWRWHRTSVINWRNDFVKCNNCCEWLWIVYFCPSPFNFFRSFLHNRLQKTLHLYSFNVLVIAAPLAGWLHSEQSCMRKKIHFSSTSKLSHPHSHGFLCIMEQKYIFLTRSLSFFWEWMQFVQVLLMFWK